MYKMFSPLIYEYGYEHGNPRNQVGIQDLMLRGALHINSVLQSRSCCELLLGKLAKIYVSVIGQNLVQKCGWNVTPFYIFMHKIIRTLIYEGGSEDENPCNQTRIDLTLKHVADFYTSRALPSREP